MRFIGLLAGVLGGSVATAQPIEASHVPALDSWGLVGIGAALGVAGVIAMMRLKKS